MTFTHVSRMRALVVRAGATIIRRLIVQPAVAIASADRDDEQPIPTTPNEQRRMPANGMA